MDTYRGLAVPLQGEGVPARAPVATNRPGLRWSGASGPRHADERQQNIREDCHFLFHCANSIFLSVLKSATMRLAVALQMDSSDRSTIRAGIQSPSCRARSGLTLRTLSMITSIRIPSLLSHALVVESCSPAA